MQPLPSHSLSHHSSVQLNKLFVIVVEICHKVEHNDYDKHVYSCALTKHLCCNNITASNLQNSSRILVGECSAFARQSKFQESYYHYKSFHQFVSDLFSGEFGHSICLIERDRNISCLGSGVSDLCICLTPVPGPPHSDDE